MPISLRYEDSAENLDALEPLWNALQLHHAEVTPQLDPQTRKRDDLGEAWRIRRGKYERWLADPETFFVVAEDKGGPLGYALVTVGPPYASWETGERIAELETLSVLPERRGEGVGAMLVEAVWSRLGERGVEDMAITTTRTNVGAHRFYERQGFGQAFVVYHGRRPGS